MKNKKRLIESMSLADEKFVNEAAPEKMSKKRKFLLIPLAAAILLICMLTTAGLWLFVPYSTSPGSINKYRDSEYYEIINSLNILKFEKPEYKNNFEMISNTLIDMLGIFSIGSDLKGESMGESVAPEIDMPMDYIEVTDNQVVGVIEGDRIKRSDKYIYYFNDETLRIYTIAKEDTALVGEYSIKEENCVYPEDKIEFYLSRDCNSVTIVMQKLHLSDKTTTVDVISLNVSDPAHIYEEGRFSISGAYTTSRITKDGMLLITEFAIDTKNMDFDKESSYLPQINTGDDFYTIPANDILSPQNANLTRYTVITLLDENKLELIETKACFSYSEDVYVSSDNIFLTHPYFDISDSIQNTMTDISCIRYSSKGFENTGSFTVRGYVKNQYSMDEYENMFRVVTTTNATHTDVEDPMSVPVSTMNTATGSSNASFYCFSLDTFEPLVDIQDFAPMHEEVQSVRFDGDMAYVCTSIEMSDPVFFFDLSDLDNVVIKDTGTIAGYSTSLVNFGDGYLIGIGVGDLRSTLKIEVYEETETGVRSVCAYEREYTDFSHDYKSYYISRSDRMIGLGINDNTSRYILLTFDGYQLYELLCVEIDGQPSKMRGVCIDGYLYAFGENGFKVEKFQ